MKIRGKVRGLGTFYVGGIERLEIHVDKADSHGLSTKEGRRVPITLIVDQQTYHAGLRSMTDCKYVWISPDVVDVTNGNKTKLGYVLPAAGFKRNQHVELHVSGSEVTVK